MRERRVVQMIEELESHAKSFRKDILQKPNESETQAEPVSSKQKWICSPNC